MTKAFDWIAWGWIALLASTLLLAVALLVGWVAYEGFKWLLSQGWATVAVVAFCAMSVWSGYRVEHSPPPWGEARSDEDVSK